MFYTAQKRPCKFTETLQVKCEFTFLKKVQMNNEYDVNFTICSSLFSVAVGDLIIIYIIISLVLVTLLRTSENFFLTCMPRVLSRGRASRNGKNLSTKIGPKLKFVSV